MSADERGATPWKSLWEFLKTLANISVPIVIAVMGAIVNESIKESENRIRYLELAVTQLRQTPTPETRALRDWATELLVKYSPVPFSEEAKTQLKSTALPSPQCAVVPGGVGTGKGLGFGGDASTTNNHQQTQAPETLAR